MKNRPDFIANRMFRVVNRPVLMATLAILAILISGVNAQDRGAIKWLDDFDQALGKAQAENKPIFIEFFNPN